MRKPEVERWRRFFEARESGLGVEQAARKARLSPSSAYRFTRGDQTSGGHEAAAILGIETVAGDYIEPPLAPEVVATLSSFPDFRMRYFGRRSTPWQADAAARVAAYTESPRKDFVVINCPPGAGKSTLFTHDILCWLIARNRRIRILIGSRTERQARMYVRRIKNTLERQTPAIADSDRIAQGIEWDAKACMLDDFGAFQPAGRSDLWTANALVVRQPGGVKADDKEPTVSAYGRDSGSLGGRFDLVLWDDLIDSKNTKGQESREDLQEWWDSEAEKRLEPGGTLILQGQRIRRGDLYAYCLDKRTLDDSDKYQHVVYKAHDEDRCTGEHAGKMEPWPASCLLDPWRIPWSDLAAEKANNPKVFAVQYQQEEGFAEAGMLDPVWIEGGRDRWGYNAPGCKDTQRVMGLVPEHLRNREVAWSFVTVDPSPTEWWGIIWWVYDPSSDNRLVVDLIRERLPVERFLTMDLDSKKFSGVMADLYQASKDQGLPIDTCVFEVNTAQRWALQQPHIQRWSALTGVRFVPHTTSRNKNDVDYGLESIADLFRQGKIRLPYGDMNSSRKSALLVEEGLMYPEADTTDLLMSTWFGKLAVENLYRPYAAYQPRMPRPDFLTRSVGTRHGLWRRSA